MLKILGIFFINFTSRCRLSLCIQVTLSPFCFVQRLLFLSLSLLPLTPLKIMLIKSLGQNPPIWRREFRYLKTHFNWACTKGVTSLVVGERERQLPSTSFQNPLANCRVEKQSARPSLIMVGIGSYTSGGEQTLQLFRSPAAELVVGWSEVFE